MDATAVWLPLLLGGIFSLVGIGLFIFGLVQRKKAKQAEQWPTLPGTVVSSRVESKTSREHNHDRSYTRTTHMPVVEYTYEYMGKSYQGSRIFPGARMSFDLGTAQDIVNRYQAGQATTVHYNPADLTDVVLETKSKGSSLMLILGAVFAVIGIVACCAGIGFLAVSA
jgi:hypothetical protein